jgi:hypothetical protein
MSRTKAIAALLRHPAPVRTPLAHELRGTVVQLLGPGTTVPTWTATPEVLATVIDSALQKDTARRAKRGGTGESTARAEILTVLEDAGYNAAAARELLARAFREPHTSPPAHDARETLAGGHALIVQYGDRELHGSCQCGRRLGLIRPDKPMDGLGALWERHTCTELPTAAAPVGAS